MKISFPTNDRKTIAKRTGRCEEFAIYEIENSEIKNIEYLKNTHEHHDHGGGHGNDHGHHSHKKGEGEHSHKETMEILKGIDILIVGRLGKYMKKGLTDNNIKYNLTKKPGIDEALEDYMAHNS